MKSRSSVLAAIAAGGFVWFASGLFASQTALAGPPVSGSGGCCVPPPTTCCKPAPTPPPPPPPQYQPPKGGGGGGGPRHNVYVPGVNVYVAPSVVVNANVNAYAYAYGGSATAYGGSGGTASAFSDALGIAQGSGYGGGGGQMFYTPPMATGYIQGLTVEGPERRQKVAFESTRRTTRRVVIQAFCLDDRDVPHPASQVTPDREIGDYEGEIFRCIAGTRLQYVVAEFTGKIAFDGGQTTVCNKSDSLYYTPNGQGGGTLSCRPQKAARECNERSLLRRFGAGVKILTIVSSERFTEYREEVVRETSSVVSNLALDGGVGGVAY
jgi:hypothetical protein